MKNKLFAILLVAAICATSVFGLISCASTAPKTQEQPQAASQTDKKIKIAMSVLNLANPTFVHLSEGAKAEADKQGVEFMLNDPQDKPEKQIAALENFIASDVDGIIITATDPEAVAPIIRTALDKGIKVICVTTPLEGADGYLGNDEYSMGATLGEAVGQWIKENWRVNETIEAGILNFDTIPAVIARKQGIKEGVAKHAPNVQFVADATAGDPTTGMAATENFLQAAPNLRMVLGINDGGALGAYEAFKSAGKTDGDQFLIAGIEGSPEALAKIKENGIFKITIDMATEEMGITAMQNMMKAIRGESFETNYLQELKPVSFSNIDEFLK